MLVSAHAHRLDHRQLTIADAVKDVSRTFSDYADVDFDHDLVDLSITASLQLWQQWDDGIERMAMPCALAGLSSITVAPARNVMFAPSHRARGLVRRSGQLEFSIPARCSTKILEPLRPILANRFLGVSVQGSEVPATNTG